jgi:hypothetical protein
MRLLVAALVAGCSVLPLAAHAQAPAAQAQAGQSDAAALALAKMVAPLEAHVEAELELARTGVLKLPEANDEARALEAEYPGIHQAMWTAMEPELRASLTSDLPKLWERLARVYKDMLSPPQMQALARFYATPTGQRMLHTIATEADPTPLVEAAFVDPESKISKEVFEKSNAAGRAAFVASLGEADRPALEQLGRIVPLARLNAVGARVQQVALEWINEEDPAADARLDAVVQPVVEKFMAEAGARK